MCVCVFIIGGGRYSRRRRTKTAQVPVCMCVHVWCVCVYVWCICVVCMCVSVYVCVSV